MTFGERLKALLKVNNAKQKDLAKYVKVSEGVVSRWTKDLRQPHIKSLTLICEFFGIDTNVLMGAYPIIDKMLKNYLEGVDNEKTI